MVGYFMVPNTFQSVALLMLIFSFFQNAILAQFEGVTLFWLGDQKLNSTAKFVSGDRLGLLLGVFTIGAILEIVHISMLKFYY